MGKTYSGSNGRRNDNNKRNSVMAEALAIAQFVPPPEKEVGENLHDHLLNLFNGVLGEYRFYGLSCELKMFTPKDPKKNPYPMLYVQDWGRGHEVGEILAQATACQHSFGIPLAELRPHPRQVNWWAPTETTFNAKVALAYFLHGQKDFVEVAKDWWQEQSIKDAKALAEKQAKATQAKINELRLQANRRQLRVEFIPLTEKNAINLVRYTPQLKFSIFDPETGAAIYVSTDVQKIYIEDIDPEHPLMSTEPVGFFINRAALRSMEDIPGESEVAKRAYKVRCYLRALPLIVEALKPRAKPTDESQKARNVVNLFPDQEAYRGNVDGSEALSAAS